MRRIIALAATMSLLLLAGGCREKGPSVTTRLCRAAAAGDVEQVRALLAQGARINGKDSDWLTPLHHAAEKGRVEVVRVLLDAGADVDAKTDYRHTPLYRAGQATTVEVLLAHNADPDVKTWKGDTALLCNIVPSWRREDSQAREAIAELLVLGGADVNVKKAFRSRSVLHEAIAYSSSRTVELLLKHGANVDAEDEEGRTPLHDAVSRERMDVMLLLLSHGARAAASTADGTSPLHLAVLHGQVEMVRTLIENGANLNVVVTGEERWWNGTPLLLALRRRESAIADGLLDAGANVNTPDANGFTPLHGAAEEGYLDIARRIVALGADISASTDSGETPLWRSRAATRNWRSSSSREVPT